MKDLKDLYPHKGRSTSGKPIWRLRPGRIAVILLMVLCATYSVAALTAKWKNRESRASEELSTGDSTLSAENGAGDGQDGGNACASQTFRDVVKHQDTFETVLKRNSVPREEMFPMLEAAKGHYNLNRVVLGRPFRFTFADSLLTALEYEIDEDRYLRLERGDSAESSWSAEVLDTPYEVDERSVCGTISSSLYNTVMDIYGIPELALKLSEVYAWQIDFHSDIQKEDSFKVVFQEKVHPNGTRRVGEILAAVFYTRQSSFYAIRFANADNKEDYFDLQGHSLRRKFLRSPFKYMPRISSRFSMRRFHPILKIFRPHLGIDYAAPTGTPVLALGDGRVTSIGRNGGFGKYIAVKHNGMYTTSYGHLSRYAAGLRKGSEVRQGQVIGYVGSTGLATGPHLDFRFYKNGGPVNPLTVDIPSGDPVHTSLADKYAAQRDRVVSILESLGQKPMPLAAAEPSQKKASSEDARAESE